MLVRAPRVGRHLFERCGSRGRERDKSIEAWRKDPGPAERKLFWPKRQERETRLNGNSNEDGNFIKMKKRNESILSAEELFL